MQHSSSSCAHRAVASRINSMPSGTGHSTCTGGDYKLKLPALLHSGRMRTARVASAARARATEILVWLLCTKSKRGRSR
eukprot:61287-Prymnesium_polylepis.1